MVISGSEPLSPISHLSDNALALARDLKYHSGQGCWLTRSSRHTKAFRIPYPDAAAGAP
jgi:hypothetical protein